MDIFICIYNEIYVNMFVCLDINTYICKCNYI